MKSIFTSKTFWANIGVGVIGVFTDGLANVGLSAEWYAGIVAVGNIGLRLLTKEAVTIK